MEVKKIKIKLQAGGKAQSLRLLTDESSSKDVGKRGISFKISKKYPKKKDQLGNVYEEYEQD